MKISGRVWKFGANIDTDAIIPARYLNSADLANLAAHCMEDADPEFPKKVQVGDLIVAGPNFGCGSSREHAPLALKAAGIAGIIAPSFARIFYRNAINIGLPILEAPVAAEAIQEGETITIDLENGLITQANGTSYQAKPFPQFMQQLIAAGGLIAYTREKVNPHA